MVNKSFIDDTMRRIPPISIILIMTLALLSVSPRLSRLRSDPRQVSAARAVASSAVAVISGRGGTGKTEVVTSVLEEIEEMEKKLEEEEARKEEVGIEVYLQQYAAVKISRRIHLGALA